MLGDYKEDVMECFDEFYNNGKISKGSALSSSPLFRSLEEQQCNTQKIFRPISLVLVYIV